MNFIFILRGKPSPPPTRIRPKNEYFPTLPVYARFVIFSLQKRFLRLIEVGLLFLTNKIVYRDWTDRNIKLHFFMENPFQAISMTLGLKLKLPGSRGLSAW